MGLTLRLLMELPVADGARYPPLRPGLNKTGNATLALNPAQTFSDLTVTNNVTAVPGPTTGDHLVNKTYADGTFATQPTVATLTGRVGTNETNIAGLTTSKQDVVTAGAGLTKTGATLSQQHRYNHIKFTQHLGERNNYVQFSMSNTSVTNAGFSFAVNGSAPGAAFTGAGGFYVWSNILSNYCFGWKSSGET
ncbi:hypothetical protein HDU90_006511 [Geranomyces variabilis]|nr:hypothetical protein HDU90_006511 [Geranomyces variabilis]